MALENLVTTAFKVVFPISISRLMGQAASNKPREKDYKATSFKTTSRLLDLLLMIPMRSFPIGFLLAEMRMMTWLDLLMMSASAYGPENKL